MLRETWFILPVRTSVLINCWYGMYRAIPNRIEYTDIRYMGAYRYTACISD